MRAGLLSTDLCCWSRTARCFPRNRMHFGNVSDLAALAPQHHEPWTAVESDMPAGESCRCRLKARKLCPRSSPFQGWRCPRAPPTCRQSSTSVRCGAGAPLPSPASHVTASAGHTGRPPQRHNGQVHSRRSCAGLLPAQDRLVQHEKRSRACYLGLRHRLAPGRTAQQPACRSSSPRKAGPTLAYE